IRESAFAGEFFNPKLGLKKRGLLQEKSPLDRQMTRTCQKNLPVGDFSVVCAVEQKNNNFYFILSKPSCSNERVC
ncbi:hypothetical protein, partial [Negativibacillus massiliensis]|uniref:hypothetical protein n=1 Tax=Negativibacillus massiliensis TaxID=1871035 RepID=UPI003AF887B5